jgi:hypothetical protein
MNAEPANEAYNIPSDVVPHVPRVGPTWFWAAKNAKNKIKKDKHRADKRLLSGVIYGAFSFFIFSILSDDILLC